MYLYNFLFLESGEQGSPELIDRLIGFAVTILISRLLIF